MARGGGRGGVQVRDLGWRQIKTSARGLHGRGVKVGFRAGSGSNDGVPIVEYAAYNEFGTATSPARPFMRRTADQNQREVGDFARTLAAGVIAGRMNANMALNRLGLFYQNLIQTTITSARSWAEPLSPVTIKRKGSSAPLIDKGILRGAVSYEVE